jgi:hypothetical protein
MRCRNAQILMTRQLREPLAPLESAALERHLAGCPWCCAEQTALRQLSARLQDAPPAPTPMPRPLSASGWTAAYSQLLSPGRDRVRANNPIAWGRGAAPMSALLAPAGAALALAALAGALGLVLRHLAAPGDTGRRVARQGMSTAREHAVANGSIPGKNFRSPTNPQRGHRPSPPLMASTRASSGGWQPPVPGLSIPVPLRPVDPGSMEKSRPDRPAHARGDLDFMNDDPVRTAYLWSTLSPDEWARVEARVRLNVRVKDDFVQIPFTRLASASGRQIVAAVEQYRREAAVVDARLAREATCAFKATALSDLCEKLRADSGIDLRAGPSVADEKVTLFCEKIPLREVMRQLSRPFGYTWLRSGLPSPSGGGAGGRGYRYELVQDLKSQLVEEELRNRDRNQALLALEKEIDRYRPYLTLSPDEALARAKTAAPGDKQLLEKLANYGWGPAQMYFRLSREDQAALRAGKWLVFSQEPKPGELPLPSDLAHGVLQCDRRWRLLQHEDGTLDLTLDQTDPRSRPLAESPDVRAKLAVQMVQSELGVFALTGASGAFAAPGAKGGFGTLDNDGQPLGVGVSAAVRRPDNRKLNARLARDPSLQPRVRVRPQPRAAARDARPRVIASGSPAAEGGDGRQASSEPRVTTADVLEAVHRATGMPIVADYYTRLYPPGKLSVVDHPLFDALNQLADEMRLRWNKDAGAGEPGGWLQFRSTTYYDDRLKEVPNRLLERWAASRRQHGRLTIDDLMEIVQLSDAQLDATEGAREIWGLEEWDLARSTVQRPHLRFLAGFTPAQREEALSPAGLAFTRMSLPQQQRFIAFGLEHDDRPLQSLDELAGSVLRVDYTQPGWFEWRPPGPDVLRWVVPVEPVPGGRRALRPPVRARTRQDALAAARRFDPQLQQAMRQVIHRLDPRAEATTAEDAEIVPTRLDLTIIYVPGDTNRRPLHILRSQQDLTSNPVPPQP